MAMQLIRSEDYRADPLWLQLATMRVEAEGAAVTFTDKLAREQGWSRARAEAVCEEYRRFLYLAATSPDPVSPSETIDRCWHLHLTYSRHYWEVLCGAILKRPLHHDPSAGGAAEDARHADQYRRTLDAYRATFFVEPPASVWGPSADSRAQTGRRAATIAGAVGATLLLAACTASGEGGWIWFPVVVVGALVLIVVAGVRSASTPSGRKRRTGGEGGGGGGDCGSSSCGNDSDSNSSSDGGSSCGGGGCGGGGD